jgi:hypothetical protein
MPQRLTLAFCNRWTGLTLAMLALLAAGCREEAQELGPSEAVALPPDTVRLAPGLAAYRCERQPLVLDGRPAADSADTSTRSYTYRWLPPGDTTRYFRPPAPGAYRLLRRRGDPETPDTLPFTIRPDTIRPLEEVFTPNGDSLREQWRVVVPCAQQARLRLYDPGDTFRLLAEQTRKRPEGASEAARRIELDWDGTNKEGNPMPQGSYYYELAVRRLDGTEQTAEGYVRLLR